MEMPVKIEIRGVIIQNDYQWIYDLFEIEATSPGKVTKAIAEANGDDIEVIINSGGGDVFSGSEIYTALKEYPGKTTGKIVGVAASAASVAAMGVDNLLMSPTAQLMIHNASTITRGDKRDHRHTADFLQTVDSSIANAYRLKTGLSQTELQALMNRESWMNAQDALAKGFIDEIMFDEGGQLRAVASTHTEMIPERVIEKIRNEFANLKKKGEVNILDNNQQIQTAVAQQVATPQATNTSPQATAVPQPIVAPQAVVTSQPTATAPVVDYAAQERERLKAIDAIAASIDPELVNEAKYGENPMSAEQLAFRAMKEGKMINSGLFENAVAANKAAGTDGVQAQALTQGTEKEFDLNNLKDVNAVFSTMAANAMAGRPQNLRRG